MFSGPSIVAASRPTSGVRVAFASALLGAALGALAAPPPGHPSPADAMQMMMPGGARPAAASHVGEVLGSIDANEYTYVELSENGRAVWIATAKVTVSRGDLIRYDDGVVMTDFYSKLLQRTFPSVMFVSDVTVTPKGN